MRAPIFPVFSLKTYKNFVIYAGGGGNKDFGKQNGIGILDETTCTDIAYYSTEDLILEVVVSGETVIEYDEDDLDWTSHSALASLYNKNSSMNLEQNSIYEKAHTTGELSSTNIDSSEEHTTSDEIVHIENSSVLNLKDEQKNIYLACRGTSFFYLLEFDNINFKLIKQVELQISTIIFNRDLFFILEQVLYTIYDVINNSEKLLNLQKVPKQKTNRPSVLNDSSQEEYVYTLGLKNTNIVVKREEGSLDVPDNWTHVFIYKTKIHKVVKEGSNFSFVYNRKKYTYDTEIGDIKCNKDGILVLFLKKVDSLLIFIDENSQTIPIKKITCINIDDEYITVGTGDGVGILYKDCIEIFRKRLCKLPITGVSYRNGYMYYSSFDGLINRQLVSTFKNGRIIFASILFLIIAILIGFFIPRK